MQIKHIRIHFYLLIELEEDWWEIHEGLHLANKIALLELTHKHGAKLWDRDSDRILWPMIPWWSYVWCVHASQAEHVTFSYFKECQLSKHFNLVYADVWGPYLLMPWTKFWYFVIFVDDKWKATQLYFMKIWVNVTFFK